MRPLIILTAFLAALATSAQFGPCDVSLVSTPITCAGDDNGTITVVENSGGPYTFIWGHDPNLTTGTATALPPGAYTVQVTDGTTCDTLLFLLLEDPAINILGTTDYCPSDPPLLSADPIGGFQPDIFLWSTSEETSSIQIPAGTNGQIDLTATDTITGCVATAQVVLNELPSPTVAFATPDTTCVNVLTLVNTVATTADSLVWRWADFGFSNELNPLIHFTQPGWGQVSLQGFDSLGCGGLAIQDSIYAQAQVPAILSVVQVPCTPFVDIVLGSTADSCAFFIGDSLITNICSGYIRYDMRRYLEYTYTHYATQLNGCNDTVGVVVDVRTEPTLFLANAFTPNEDGINDFWPVRTDIPDTGYELKVYDRWGLEIWSTIDPEEQWDGQADGAQVPLGVYVYTMKMRDPCEPTNELTSTGHVTIFR